ncbi:MAG: hypothetical protein H6679_04160 [Epsilonproteobacteria bacterium]|nr:hypothetical protein [Campylobacterota bacterium]
MKHFIIHRRFFALLVLGTGLALLSSSTVNAADKTARKDKATRRTEATRAQKGLAKMQKLQTPEAPTVKGLKKGLKEEIKAYAPLSKREKTKKRIEKGEEAVEAYKSEIKTLEEQQTALKAAGKEGKLAKKSKKKDSRQKELEKEEAKLKKRREELKQIEEDKTVKKIKETQEKLEEATGHRTEANKLAEESAQEAAKAKKLEEEGNFEEAQKATEKAEVLDSSSKELTKKAENIENAIKVNFVKESEIDSSILNAEKELGNLKQDFSPSGLKKKRELKKQLRRLKRRQELRDAAIEELTPVTDRITQAQTKLAELEKTPNPTKAEQKQLRRLKRKVRALRRQQPLPDQIKFANDDLKAAETDFLKTVDESKFIDDAGKQVKQELERTRTSLKELEAKDPKTADDQLKIQSSRKRIAQLELSPTYVTKIDPDAPLDKQLEETTSLLKTLQRKTPQSDEDQAMIKSLEENQKILEDGVKQTAKLRLKQKRLKKEQKPEEKIEEMEGMIKELDAKMKELGDPKLAKEFEKRKDKLQKKIKETEEFELGARPFIQRIQKQIDEAPPGEKAALQAKYKNKLKQLEEELGPQDAFEVSRLNYEKIKDDPNVPEATKVKVRKKFVENREKYESNEYLQKDSKHLAEKQARLTPEAEAEAKTKLQAKEAQLKELTSGVGRFKPANREEADKLRMDIADLKSELLVETSNQQQVPIKAKLLEFQISQASGSKKENLEAELDALKESNPSLFKEDGSLVREPEIPAGSGDNPEKYLTKQVKEFKKEAEAAQKKVGLSEQDMIDLERFGFIKGGDMSFTKGMEMQTMKQQFGMSKRGKKQQKMEKDEDWLIGSEVEAGTGKRRGFVIKGRDSGAKTEDAPEGEMVGIHKLIGRKIKRGYRKQKEAVKEEGKIGYLKKRKKSLALAAVAVGGVGVMGMMMSGGIGQSEEEDLAGQEMFNQQMGKAKGELKNADEDLDLETYFDESELEDVETIFEDVDELLGQTKDTPATDVAFEADDLFKDIEATAGSGSTTRDDGELFGDLDEGGGSSLDDADLFF